MTPLKKYLKEETLPPGKREARRTKLKAPQYELRGDMLYRRFYLQSLLWCVSPNEANYLIREVHKGA